MNYEDYFKETEQYRHQVEIIDAILEEQNRGNTLQHHKKDNYLKTNITYKKVINNNYVVEKSESFL